MKNLLEYLARQIVDKPEEVVVNESVDSQGITNLELSVDTSDMGKVIGKGGRIIKALRDLVRVLAVKKNLRINVALLEH